MAVFQSETVQRHGINSGQSWTVKVYWFSTVAELNAQSASTGDYCYCNETGWIYFWVGSWQRMARMSDIGSVAYTNIQNNFIARQSISGAGNAGTAYNQAALEVVNWNSAPRLALHWSGVVASQIGIDSGGSIQILDSGTGYASLKCSSLRTNGGGHVYGGAIFPGRYDGTWENQASWWLGSHAAYGLYSNTGLRCEGAMSTGGGFSCATDINCANLIAGTQVVANSRLFSYGTIYSVGAINELNRGTALGHWITGGYAAGNFLSYSAGSWNVDASDLQCYAYTLIGKTMIFSFELVNTVVSATGNQYLRMIIPDGYTAARYMSSVGRSYNSAQGSYPIWIWSQPGNTIYISKTDGNVFSNTSDLAVYGQISFQIN